MNLTDLGRADAFIEWARLNAKFKSELGALRAAAAERGLPDRVASWCKAASDAGSVSDLAFASSLAFSESSGAFVETLASFGLLDAAIGANEVVRVPASNSRIGLMTATGSATTVTEGQAIPVIEHETDNAQIDESRVSGIIVLTDELTRNTSTAARMMLAREMRQQIALATDRAWLAIALNGVTPTPSAGATATNILADIEALLDALSPKARSRVRLGADATTCRKLATKADTGGRLAFPEMTPTGGLICGLPVSCTDGLDTYRDSDGGYLVAIDGSRVAVDAGAVVVDASRQACLQMATDPDNPTIASSVLVSLWARGWSALKFERRFGAKVFRSGAVAAINAVAY